MRAEVAGEGARQGSLPGRRTAQKGTESRTRSPGLHRTSPCISQKNVAVSVQVQMIICFNTRTLKFKVRKSSTLLSRRPQHHPGASGERAPGPRRRRLGQAPGIAANRCGAGLAFYRYWTWGSTAQTALCEAPDHQEGSWSLHTQLLSILVCTSTQPGDCNKPLVTVSSHPHNMGRGVCVWEPHRGLVSNQNQTKMSPVEAEPALFPDNISPMRIQFQQVKFKEI